ncbi:Cyclomaltodextrin glucanotransferase [Rhodanobacter sp. Root179]|uniref:alpha-amylase family glycosyl hydrolase n=1 Tax=unclassified Rhodanobacter TaxID=2621553 RepID=UPI00070011E0|nr:MULTISPECIES: alpha-amylase family glycosyl hydrolase [unclassified Rhodanobacter]KQZ69117.1 cyclomaltodextrin glucanotransferase [Rhodanobacter sp. Root561]KRB42637.1 cyclomaltodextrin glucanotransferase [Rhodanobacter sp. Root179]
MIRTTVLALATLTLHCGGARAADTTPEFVGTDAPMASNAIYFVMTDRFVNGDPSNDQRDQGGAHRTFDVPVAGAPKGESANIGYLGGDFRGVLDNAAYIRGMGFGAVWITPIVDNPDEAFTGGDPVSWGSKFTDRGKTGFHGYWGVNFYKLDEHLPSRNLDFRQFTTAMRAQGLKTVLDIVANHGSPAFSMPQAQPMFGQIYDKDGKLVADQQNLPPYRLDPVRNPLHRFYHAYDDLVQLSNNDDRNPAVLDYFAGAYNQWADQGADAFRIDTISHMSNTFWKQFAARIRAKHPGFFMFGEAFDYSPDNIGQYTWPENGGISVLDFPLRGRIADVFEHPGSDYAQLLDRLYLTNGPYQNPYELVTFYDNHDMARLAASDNGFIDANNWLFTARGIPAIYYGSETGFERGKAEHQGNRNYYGQQRIDAAPKSPIYRQLKRIAQLREKTPALQRGLMLPLHFAGNRAAFYRVYQKGDVHQIALVLLNKGDAVAQFDIGDYLQSGTWTPAFGGPPIEVRAAGKLRANVAPHDVKIYLLDASASRNDLTVELTRLMAERAHPAD